jgi:hypothetical protein
MWRPSIGFVRVRKRDDARSFAGQHFKAVIYTDKSEVSGNSLDGVTSFVKSDHARLAGFLEVNVAIIVETTITVFCNGIDHLIYRKLSLGLELHAIGALRPGATFNDNQAKDSSPQTAVEYVRHIDPVQNRSDWQPDTGGVGKHCPLQ